jgi:hypothetical protein
MGETRTFILLYKKRENEYLGLEHGFENWRGQVGVEVGNDISVQEWGYHLHTSEMYGNTEMDIRISEQ